MTTRGQSHRILVRNKSSYPDAEVKAITRKVLRDLECRDVCVTVTNRRVTGKDRLDRWCGGHYREFWYKSKGEDRAQITVTLPSADLFPVTYIPYERTHGECPSFLMETWQEGLIAIVAHEGRHHLQTPRNSYGTTKKRGRYVEAECDQAAYRYVLHHRQDAGLPEPEVKS